MKTKNVHDELKNSEVQRKVSVNNAEPGNPAEEDHFHNLH